MSVTTASKPQFDPFRDEYSFSEGLSFDSFILVNDPRCRKPPQKAVKEEPLSPLQLFLRPFMQCCAPRSRDGKKIRINISSYSTTTRTSVVSLDIPNGFNRDEEDIENLEAISKQSKSIMWYISVPYEYGVPMVTETQRQYACLLWGVKSEYGSTTTEKSVQKIFKVASERREGSDIIKEYKANPDLQILKLHRDGLSVTADEAFNEILSYYSPKYSILAIISRGRCFAFYSQASEDKSNVTFMLFDSSSKYGSGPKVFGFKDLNSLKEHVISEFGRDHETRLKVSEGFRVTVFQGRVMWNTTFDMPNTIIKKDYKEKNEAMIRLGRLNDPKFDAKVVYGELQKATTRPTDQDYFFTYQNNMMRITK
ncbi:hypothetical protein OIY81_3402 [Cryptosporidium canis]|uniref:TLDc domain-containing protein n=1 Tax=Cryptosporidium canis TaxID=195482 RepID=A0ABQ8P612_9CRYT|nr:hypothetical protein OIY81_3402 [Cryptosporidium canis]KAJ1609153.1 hypothetical protein OJ252_2283 [Cryptosporidium canis]